MNDGERSGAGMGWVSRHKRDIVLIGGVLMLGLLLRLAFGPSSTATATRATTPAATAPARKPAPVTMHTVRYVVTVGASGVSSITYSNDQGGIEQSDNVQGDWEKTYLMPAGAFAALSAQNQHDAGSVQCTIVVDGVVWKQSTSQGAYVIADCNGLIGQ